MPLVKVHYQGKTHALWIGPFTPKEKVEELIDSIYFTSSQSRMALVNKRTIIYFPSDAVITVHTPFFLLRWLRRILLKLGV